MKLTEHGISGILKCESLKLKSICVCKFWNEIKLPWWN